MLLYRLSHRLKGPSLTQALAAPSNDIGLDGALSRLAALRKGNKPKITNSNSENPKSVPKAPAHAKPTTQKKASEPIKASKPSPQSKKTIPKPGPSDDDDEIDMDKIWSAVDAAIAKNNKGKTKGKKLVAEDDETEEEVSHQPSPASSSSSASASASASTSGFKGFGLPPSPSSSNGKNSKGQKKSLPLSSAQDSPSPSSSNKVFRIYLHNTEEALARKAITDAGLSNRVLIEPDVSQCQAVVCAKLTRQGKQVKLQQGERTANNHKIPFICVGRSMTGPSLRAALRPLMYPSSVSKEGKKGANGEDKGLTREAAREAVRAVRASGASYFPPPPSTTPHPLATQLVVDLLPAAASTTSLSTQDHSDADDDVEEAEEEEELDEEGDVTMVAQPPRASGKKLTLRTRTQSKLRLSSRVSR